MQPRGPAPVFDFVSGKRPVISGVGATRTLNEAESGSIVLLDKVDGQTITLPTGGCAPGTYFDFYVSATTTSSAAKVITGVATELIVGQIVNCDTDSSDAVAIWKSLVETANISVNLNGTTKGGIKGDSFRLTKLNATTWNISGNTNGTGVVATPFATS